MEEKSGVTFIDEQKQTGIAPIMSQILSGSVPAEKLEQVMELQERYEANEARKAYNKAMSLFSASAPALSKNAHVNYTGQKGVTDYKHITLGYALGQIQPVLGQYGLSLTWKTEQGEGGVRVTARVTHEGGHYEETTLFSPPDSSGGKNPIQSLGSAVTYLKRYTAFALLGLESIEDDDGMSTGEMMTREEFVAIQELPVYSDENFLKLEKSMREKIKSGEKSAEGLIQFISTKNKLTEKQISDIKSWEQ